MDKNSEKYLEEALRIRIAQKGGWCLKWVSPGTRGVCDRLIFMPNGKLYIREIKTLGEVLHPLQFMVIKKLKELGFDVEIIDSKLKLDEFIQTL